MSEIDPRLPASVGGGGASSGGVILKGKQREPDEAPPKETPKEPWNDEYCYRVVVGLDPTRLYFVADNQDDATSGVGPLPGGHQMDNAWSVDRGDEAVAKPSTLRNHKKIFFMGLGIIIEIVKKPVWWGGKKS